MKISIKNKKSIIVLVSLIVVFICIFYIMGIFYKTDRNLSREENEYLIREKKEKEIKELVNITDLSQEFLDNYFNEVNNLTEDESNNLLMVISKDKVKNTYGAKKVIEAPNNQYLLIYNSSKTRDNAFNKLKKNSEIISVEKNGFLEQEISTDDFGVMTAESISDYNSWGVERYGYDHAVNTINSLMQTEPDRINDVVVAVIDSGLNVGVFEQNYGKDKLFGTHNVIDGGTDVTDKDGHGTHTMGTVAETTPDNVKILAIKARRDSDGSFQINKLIDAINYAVAQKVDVISFSIGGYGYYDPIKSAIDGARKAGVIFVASSGNDNTDRFHLPSSYDSGISVGANDSNMERAIFSNYGEDVDFSSAGFFVASLNYKGGAPAIKFGTSMSTPHVAGAVAILKSFNKDIGLEDTINLLKKHSIDVGDDGWDPYYGHGVVSFKNAVFCSNGIECDDYGIFKDDEFNGFSTIRIQGPDVFVPKYNYGSNANLFNLKFKLYYTNDEYYTKSLSQLVDKIEIVGYNPDVKEMQNVTFKYKDFIINVNIDNSKMVDGWKYIEVSDGIKLTEFVYDSSLLPNLNNVDSLVSYASSVFPNVIHIPDEIDGKPVVELGDRLFFEPIAPFTVNLKKIFIPSSVKRIGDRAFGMKLTSLTYSFAGPLQIVFNSDIDVHNKETFFVEYTNAVEEPSIEGNRYNMIIYTFKDSSIYNYSISHNDEVKRQIDNKVSGVSSDHYIDYLYLEQVNIDLLKNDFKVFDKINSEDLSINVTYTGNIDSVNEKITNFEIKYNNGNDSFSLGDTSFIVSFDTSVGQHVEREVSVEISPVIINKPSMVDKEYVYNGIEQEFELEGYDENTMSISNNYRKNAGEQEVIVVLEDSNYVWEDGTSDEIKFVFKIEKAIPEYVIPTDLNARLNQKLSEVKLTENFEWMDGTQQLNEAGNKIFKARYIPADRDNYETVENIDVSVLVFKDVVVPEIEIKDKIYDGTTLIDLDSISISNLDNLDYTVESAELISVDVGKTTAKVKIKLSDNIFINYEFENGEQEQEFSVDVKIVPQKIKKPLVVDKTYIYNGEEHDFELEGYNENTMSISNNTRKNAGEQEVIVLPKNSNYVWEDGTSDEVKFTFKIEKANLDIEYESSDNEVTYDGKEYGIILNVNGSEDVKIKYMDKNGDYVLDSMPMYADAGEYVIKYKIFIDDNYTEIDDENILKINKLVIDNSTVDYEGIYDGSEYSISVDFNVDNYDIKYSVNNDDYNLDKIPKFKNVGEYTVNYKVTCKNCETLYGSNKVRIYGIKGFDKTLSVKDNIFVVKNNSFSNIKGKVFVYAKDVLYNHFDKDMGKISSDITKTGDIIEINLNNSKAFKYYISIIGDVNGDGKISSADYVKIKKHIMEMEKIKDNIYIYSADINNDNKISSADYVKIRKYIMNGDSL